MARSNQEPGPPDSVADPPLKMYERVIIVIILTILVVALRAYGLHA